MSHITLKHSLLLTLLTLLSTSLVPTTAEGQRLTWHDRVPVDTLVAMLRGKHVTTERPITVKNIVVSDNAVSVRLSDNARQLPLTSKQLEPIKDSLRTWLEVPWAEVTFRTSEGNLNDILLCDSATCGMPAKGSTVTRTDWGWTGPLTGRNVALWASHGRYYENKLDRWEWQRGRLFTTAEDLLTSSFVLPFLVPMMENAGAMVLMPRERDTTRMVCIVDNADGAPAFTTTATPLKKLPNKSLGTVKGYGRYTTLTSLQNPFLMGTAVFYNMADGDSIVFRGRTEADGPQTIYVAYAQHEMACDHVIMTVHHAGGEAHYEVNQQQGGGLWLPLGTLPFEAGREWRLVIKGNGIVSADAVRIGGGMGTVMRGGTTSGMPAWAEAARYYLQTNGFDSLKVVSLSNGTNDYTDDINSRGEWVNDLINNKKMGIDLVLAIHTDAGITAPDSTIGTLGIVTTARGREQTYPDMRRRSIARQYAGIVTRQIVDDIRRGWDEDWTDRGILDKSYSESRRPDVPALLIELLSHQNLSEIRWALHPAFRHDVARAIYKGMLRYMVGQDAPVSPLPPHALALYFANEKSDGEIGSKETNSQTANSIAQQDTIRQQHTGLLRLTWSPTVDTLETSATATHYAVYESGRLVGTTQDTTLLIRQNCDGIVRRYAVVAIGRGGRSLPSGSVEACLWRGGRRALLVDGMDRLDAPFVLQSSEWGGVMRDQEPGVPWHGDIYSTGDQYDYVPTSPWLDDDAPGYGASFSDHEMVGNAGMSSRSWGTSMVGQRLRLAGYSFVTQSKEAFDSDTIAPADTSVYSFVRIALDRQRSTDYGLGGTRHTIFTRGFRQHVSSLVWSGIRMVVSGCYVGQESEVSEEIRQWCEQTLGFRFRTAHASRTMELTQPQRWLRDNCLENPTSVKSPRVWHPQCDAIEPVKGRARTICRYADSQMSAATEMDNVVVCGF